MNNEDLGRLADAFTQFRDILKPIQEGLCEFADTYAATRTEIGRLQDALDGDIQGNLEKIYKNMSAQSEKSADLASGIDRLLKAMERYSSAMSGTASLVGNAEKLLSAINDLEGRAEAQIEKLEQTLDERRRGYNIKELERTIEGYNQNVAKMSEYINRDVGAAIAQNGKILSEMKEENIKMTDAMQRRNLELSALLEQFSATSLTIKNAVENEAVNEEYIFEILDRWAATRKVKIRR